MRKKTLILPLWLLILTIMFIPHKAESAQDSLYDFLWLDPDKAVYVLQNKTYKKAGHFFGELNGLRVTNSEFLDAWGLNAKVGYYFSEEWGAEVSYTHYKNEFDDNYDGVKSLGSEPFLRRFTGVTTAMVLWTPFYGKVNTFNRIYYFDWGFGVGLASIAAESNIDTVGNSIINTTYKSESHTALAYKTDFKVHLNEQFTLNLELRWFTYSAPNNPSDKTANELQTHNEFLFGIGMKF